MSQERPTTPGTRPKRAPLLPTNLTERLKDTERDLLRAALEKSRFNQRLAAKFLDLSYDQLRGKLRKYDISCRPDSDARK